MKLLLDENLSYRLVARLAPAFPGTAHVDSLGLHAQTDSTIRNFARDNAFAIVLKDDDFRQLSFFYGAPPILNEKRSAIESFGSDPVESLLVLQLPEPAT